MSNLLLPLAGTLVYTIIGLFKDLRGGNMNGALTQIIAWVTGIAVFLLIAQTTFAETTGSPLGDGMLSQSSFADLFFMGLMAASLLGVVDTAFKAIDSSQTSKKPNLIDGK